MLCATRYVANDPTTLPNWSRWEESERRKKNAQNLHFNADESVGDAPGFGRKLRFGGSASEMLATIAS